MAVYNLIRGLKEEGWLVYLTLQEEDGKMQPALIDAFRSYPKGCISLKVDYEMRRMELLARKITRGKGRYRIWKARKKIIVPKFNKNYDVSRSAPTFISRLEGFVS